MTAHNPALKRWYGLLLLSYPSTYRRTRGVEMLTTLLDAAEPSQTRPTTRDSLDLVVGGLRYRFLVPRKPIPIILATVAALLGAVLVSAGTGWLAWQGSVKPVDQTSAASLANMTSGQAAPKPLYDNPNVLSTLDPLGMRSSLREQGYSGPTPAPENLAYSFPSSSIDPVGIAKDAQDRLAAAGVDTGDVVSGEQYAQFWANKDGQVVEVFAVAGTWSPTERGITWKVGDTVTLWVMVHTVAPAVVTMVAASGFVVGLALGWLVFAWALRAVRRHTTTGRVLMIVLGLTSLAAATLALTLPAIGGLIGLAMVDGWSPTDSLMPAGVLVSSPTLTIAIMAGLLLTLGIGITAPVTADPVLTTPPTSRSTAWAVSIAGFVVFACLVAVFLGLIGV